MLEWLSRIFNWIFKTPDPPKPVPRPDPVPLPDPGVTPSELVNAINAERVKRGMTALVENEQLSNSAQTWANHLASTGILDHGNFSGRIASIFPNVPMSEDIAEDQTSVPMVVSDWMSSPGHRANILGNYNRIGTGHAQSSTGHTFWVVDFIKI